MSKKNIKLKFNDIKASAKVQARVSIDEDAIKDYTAKAKEAKAKGADSPFPNLVIFTDPKGTNFLADGFHRLKSLKASGYEEAECEVREGTENDAFLFACKANLEHGVRLNSDDKKHNLSRVLEIQPDASNTVLADLAGVSEFFVRQHRPAAQSPTERVNKKGKKVKVERIGKKGGKKEKPAKAKKADKPKKDAADKEPKAKFDDETLKAIRRLTTVLGSDNSPVGPALRKAIDDGSCALSAKDLREWAGTSEGRIHKIAPLILDKGFTVNKATAFIDRVADSATKADHFILRAIANGGIDTTEEVDGHRFIVVNIKTYKVEHDKEAGVVTITPKK